MRSVPAQAVVVPTNGINSDPISQKGDLCNHTSTRFSTVLV